MHTFETRFEDLQFYPTPPALAQLAWSLFEDREFVRVLEPSAGAGDLMLPQLDGLERRWKRDFHWDAVELDPSNHPLLRERGATVVGYDFLSHVSCAIYSHIVMNPPFAQGAKHVLHAWDTLYEGEIVAIINAETLRNASSVERQRLVKVVSEHGRVEFIRDAFKGAEVYRQADVDIALIHLAKKANSSDIVDGIIDGLRADRYDAEQHTWRVPYELSLPTGFVEEAVRNFDLALAAAKECAVAQARAAHYRARLGKTMARMQQGEEPANCAVASNAGQLVRNSFATTYDDLKDSAWTGILQSTHVLSRLSHAAHKRVLSEFENIKALEFTVANVYGFLHGIVQKGGEIQLGMVCDVFDLITRYHTENTVYYMGWKSNDKHRTAGIRIKRSRFIIPGESHESYRSRASFDVLGMLGDFDRVFAMLDGKSTPAVGLRTLFESAESYQQLVRGQRLSSDYFDVRYYGGRGTIHFYPRSVEVIERLNRVVGRHRGWLPDQMDEADADFRKQYEDAEKYHAEIVAAFEHRGGRSYGGRGRLGWINSRSEETRLEVQEQLVHSLEEVLERHGLRPQPQLGSGAQMPLQLAA